LYSSDDCGDDDDDEDFNTDYHDYDVDEEMNENENRILLSKKRKVLSSQVAATSNSPEKRKRQKPWTEPLDRQLMGVKNYVEFANHVR
jgi:hypothetical protein